MDKCRKRTRKTMVSYRYASFLVISLLRVYLCGEDKYIETFFDHKDEAPKPLKNN